MKQSLLLTAAILIVGLPVAFSIKPRPAAPRAAQADRTAPAVAAQPIDLKELGALWTELRAQPPGSSDPQSPLSKRDREIRRRIELLNPDQAAVFLAALTADTVTDIRAKRMFAMTYLFPLSKKDPERTLDLLVASIPLFEKSDVGRSFPGSVLNQVAIRNPRLAFNKLMILNSEHPGFLPEGSGYNLVAAAAVTDSKLAFEYLAEFKIDVTGDRACELMKSVGAAPATESVRLSVLQEFRTWWSALPSTTDRVAVQRSFFGGMAPKVAVSGLEPSLKWMEQVSLSPEEKWAFVCALSFGSVKADPGGWLLWIDRSFPASSLPDEKSREKRGDSIRAIIESWTREDIEAVGAWLKGLPQGSFRNTCICGHAYALADKFPERAAEWVSTIPDEEIHKVMYPRIHRRATWLNPAAEEAFTEKYLSQ